MIGGTYWFGTFSRIWSLPRIFTYVAILFLFGAAAAAQETQVLQVGESAPDFELTGATRYGILSDPVRLSDFRGKTVVLAFYFEARTPG